MTNASIQSSRIERNLMPLPANVHPPTSVIPTEGAPRTRHETEISSDRAEGRFLFGAGLLDEPSRMHLASLLERMSIASDWMFVYILASKIGVLYTGVTNGIRRRNVEHRTKLNKGFTACKNCNKLVYFEIHVSPGEAIAREKQIKRWRREKKERLIRSLNPAWIDLVPFLPSSDEDSAD